MEYKIVIACACAAVFLIEHTSFIFFFFKKGFRFMNSQPFNCSKCASYWLSLCVLTYFNESLFNIIFAFQAPIITFIIKRILR